MKKTLLSSIGERVKRQSNQSIVGLLMEIDSERDVKSDTLDEHGSEV